MGRWLVIGVILGLLVSVILWAKPSSITGFATANVQQPKVQLNLTQTIYAPEETLQGTLVLNFTAPYYSDALLKLTLGEESDEITLKQLVKEQKTNVSETSGAQQAVNPTAIKILTFQNAGQQRVAWKLPDGAAIKTLAMTVEGDKQDTQYPEQPYLDIGADGIIEWKYLGALVNFSSAVYPQGFSTASESSVVMKDDGKFHCEILNLPAARDFQVQAKYKYYDSASTGNIKAYLFSYTGSGASITASGGADLCDLPESTTLGISSCNISVASEISGKYLVCVANTDVANQQKNAYTVLTDQEASSTSYTCPFFTSTGTCTKVSSSHFHIAAKAGNYQGALSKKMSLQEGKTQYDPLEAAKEEMGDCEPVEGICTLALQVGTQSKGKIYLSDLLITYVSEGLDKEERNFYDALLQRPYVEMINGVMLNNKSYTVRVDLEDFDLSLPEEERKNLTLNVLLDEQKVASASLTIEKKFSSNATITRIERIKSELLALDQSLLTKFGFTNDINPALADLESLKSRTKAIASSTNTSSEKEKALEKIKKEIDLTIRQLPRKIQSVAQIADTIPTSPQDIQGFENDATLAIVQKAYKVKGTATVYEVEFYSGQSSKHTIVEKQVAGNLAGARIAEKIPSHIISMEKVTFSTSIPPQTQGEYAIFPAASTFSYTFEGDAAQSLSLLKTVVLAPQQVTEPIASLAVRCGDNKCTSVNLNGELIPLEDVLTCPADCKKKIPYIPIIIIVLVVLLGIYYIYFYRGPGALFTHQEKPKQEQQLFKTKLDGETLVKYVRMTQEKQIDPAKVKSILFAKGWTEKQVEYAFNEVKKVKK